MVRLCHRLLGDREEARDAAQETFLKAFRGASRFRPRGQVYTWLYRIATNHCLNVLRRRRVLRFLSIGESPPDEPSDRAMNELEAGGPDAADRLVASERWRHTRRAIDALPAGQRVVLVLTKLEGLSYRETAAALGITEGAVESRLFRAMRRLTRAQEVEP